MGKKDNYKKLAVLEVVKEKRDVLFGNFKNNLTHDDKRSAWTEVLKKAQSLQLAGADKSWTYARDSLFGLWKCRALAKRDNAKKTGSEGGKDKQLDEVDAAIFDILQKDAAILDGLDLPESYMEAQATVMAATPTSVELPKGENVENTPRRKKRKLVNSPRPSTSSQDETTKLRQELLRVEIYHRKLQTLKLERELGLPPSEFTCGIAASASQEVVYMTEDCLQFISNESADR